MFVILTKLEIKIFAKKLFRRDSQRLHKEAQKGIKLSNESTLQNHHNFIFYLL